jgi:UPF0716 protein FxsA
VVTIVFRALPALLFLLMPLLEIAGFVVVGSQVGVLGTIGLVVASAILGSVLLRVQGFGALRRAQVEAATGGTPDREIVHGAMILVAGILLIIPGFITDLVGLLLFLPPVRDLAWRALRARLVVVSSRDGFAASSRRSRDPRVIDLDADDYSETERDDSPWNRPPRLPRDRGET